MIKNERRGLGVLRGLTSAEALSLIREKEMTRTLIAFLEAEAPSYVDNGCALMSKLTTDINESEKEFRAGGAKAGRISITDMQGCKAFFSSDSGELILSVSPPNSGAWNSVKILDGSVDDLIAFLQGYSEMRTKRTTSSFADPITINDHCRQYIENPSPKGWDRISKFCESRIGPSDFAMLCMAWGTRNSLYTESSRSKQVQKFFEELGEFTVAGDIDEEMDAIGDMLVCLVQCMAFDADSISNFSGLVAERYYNASAITRLGVSTYSASADLPKNTEEVIATVFLKAEAMGLNPDRCMSIAWNEIKDRELEVVDGFLVKKKTC